MAKLIIALFVILRTRLQTTRPIQYLAVIAYLEEVCDNPKEIQENSTYFRQMSCQHKSTHHLDEGRNRRCVYEKGVGQVLLAGIQHMLINISVCL